MLTKAIIMPKYGQTMTEGEIIKWKKKEGDRINQGEIILEIASDKTNLEVESEYIGFLTKIVAKEGDIVPCGQIIAYVETSENK